MHSYTASLVQPLGGGHRHSGKPLGALRSCTWTRRTRSSCERPASMHVQKSGSHHFSGHARLASVASAVARAGCASPVAFGMHTLRHQSSSANSVLALMQFFLWPWDDPPETGGESLMNSVSHGRKLASSAPTYLIDPPPSRFFSVSRATVTSVGGVGSPGHLSPTGHGNSPTGGSAGHGTAALGPHGVRGSAVLRARRALRCSRFASISFLSLRFLAVSLTRASSPAGPSPTGVGSPTGHGDSPTGHGDSPTTGHGTAPFGHDRAQTQPSESFCALCVCACRACAGTLRSAASAKRGFMLRFGDAYLELFHEGSNLFLLL